MSDETNTVVEVATTATSGALVTVLTALSQKWLEFSPIASMITWVLGTVFIVMAMIHKYHSIKKIKKTTD